MQSILLVVEIVLLEQFLLITNLLGLLYKLIHISKDRVY
jgi:hypothetical protein